MRTRREFSGKWKKPLHPSGKERIFFGQMPVVQHEHGPFPEQGQFIEEIRSQVVPNFRFPVFLLPLQVPHPFFADRRKADIQRTEQISEKNGRFRIVLSDSIPAGSQLFVLHETGDGGGFSVTRSGMDQGERRMDQPLQLFRHFRPAKGAGFGSRRDPFRFQEPHSPSHGIHLSELQSFWTKRRRMARLSILPTGVFGSSSMKRTALGILYAASLPLR